MRPLGFLLPKTQLTVLLLSTYLQESSGSGD